MIAALAMLAAAGTIRATSAAEPVDLARLSSYRDLGPVLNRIDGDQQRATIELPGANGADPLSVTLDAQGPGPGFTWLVANVVNSAAEPSQAVVSIPHQSFSGSGFLPVLPPGPRIYSALLTGGGNMERLPVLGETAYAVTLPAGGNAVIAFEVASADLPAVLMWQREGFDARKDYLSFFRGTLLGVSALLALALFALYGLRARAVFPVAGCFALSAIAFMTLEAGHLPALFSGVVSLDVLRAVIEGTMAALLLLLLSLMSELERLSRTAGTLLLTLGGLAFALPIYAFADPDTAVNLARAVFAATALLGMALVILLWWSGRTDGQTALVSWTAILIWTLIAIAAALLARPESAMPVILQTGLTAVLVVLGFVLAHHAFAQGYLSRHFFREAGRHVLALAGAKAYVWDWQPEDAELYVSPDLARVLSQPHDLFDGATGEAFLEIMHPADRSSYLASVEESVSGTRAPVERRFRLADGEGGYRWFELRARPISGQGQRAARCIGTVTDVTDAKLAEERLLHDAVYDMVTGLPNRALFMDRLERTIEAWDPAVPGSLFVLILDLDRFKFMNEALGHEVGDQMLAIIGRRIKAETGLTDTVARLPGDKFAILFHEFPNKRDVVTFAEILVKAVARPVKLDQRDFVLTASVGIGRFAGEEITPETLMKSAAIALYEARRRGPQEIELFNPSMGDERAELVILEAELRRALERSEIEVHYQPIARLSDMQLVGFEALVRWRHPKMGMLAPESFLALAEETGMIRDIGRLVLNEAGRQLGIWQRAYRTAEPPYVAVNLSSAQLIEPGLVDDVKQIINREGLLRGSFKIEVTESLVMQYPDRAAQILERFREMGVGLSCDDFGTGYSSLSSLRKLPFDTLKVDRSFISHHGQEQRGEIILSAIIAMGHELGMKVVAEGIESQAQVDRLGDLGCDHGQGYFIGRPLNGRQVTDALAGLPYATGSGRTAITWLWERAKKDPPPEPNRQPITGREATMVERPAAAAPLPPDVPAATRQEAAPAPEPLLEAPAAVPSPPEDRDAAVPDAPELDDGDEADPDDPPPAPGPRLRRPPRRVPELG